MQMSVLDRLVMSCRVRLAAQDVQWSSASISCRLAWPCRDLNLAQLTYAPLTVSVSKNTVLLDTPCTVFLLVPGMLLHISMHNFVAVSEDTMLPEMPCMVLHPAPACLLHVSMQDPVKLMFSCRGSCNNPECSCRIPHSASKDAAAQQHLRDSCS